MSELRRRTVLRLGLGATASTLPGCGPTTPSPAQPERRVRQPGDRVRFAAIGDYGVEGPAAASVAALVSGWSPDFVITLGDNNYPHGRATTIDDNIGRYYHRFIAPYVGRHGEGAELNRFFPALGNHDWLSPGARPYLEYFTLPDRERYYEVVWGPVHLIAIDSDFREPDGNTADSVQAAWVRERLAASTSPWRVVYMHHPPWSSGTHGSSPGMRWPFAEWGAHVVMSGHDHHYERIERDGIVYVVNGLGGNPDRYEIPGLVEGSSIRFREEHGAIQVEASSESLELRFVTAAGRTIDQRVLRAEAATRLAMPTP